MKNQFNVTQKTLNELLFDEDNIDNLNRAAKIATNLLQNATKLHISKMRICAKLKKWWNNDLTNLKKIMVKNRWAYKNFFTHESLMKLKKNKLKYFHEISLTKQKCWSDSLRNAKNKKIVQAYKYIKSRV